MGDLGKYKDTICRALLHRRFHLEESVGPSVEHELNKIKDAEEFMGCYKQRAISQKNKNNLKPLAIHNNCFLKT